MTSPLQQKLKVAGPIVITANRLTDGAVVYRTAEGHWTSSLHRAAVATTGAAATELLAQANADDRAAVGAYAAAVERKADGSLHPGNLREAIRLAGPTFDLPMGLARPRTSGI